MAEQPLQGAESVVIQVRRCIVHDDLAGPKDARCRYWWMATGGGVEKDLVTPCKFARPRGRTDG